MSSGNKGNQHYKARCIELEEVVELALAAFSLIPTQAIRKGYQWLPSEDALLAIEQGKDAALRYSERHWIGGNGH